MMNARVNQKAYCARVALDAAAASAGAARQALLEAALFHLVTAYRCYLREIIGPNEILDKAEPLALINAQWAQRYLQENSKHNPPELEELIQLEQGGGWLQSLLAAYTAITATSEPRGQHGGELALADITAHADIEGCRRWLEQFQQLVQRQREHAREW